MGRLRYLTAIAFTISPFTGSPAKAPLRSTRCRRRAPAFTHLVAKSTGSSPHTVESSMRPWRSLTHLPSFRSIAGIISILFFLFGKSGKEFGARTLEQGGLTVTRGQDIPLG